MALVDWTIALLKNTTIYNHVQLPYKTISDLHCGIVFNTQHGLSSSFLFFFSFFLMNWKYLLRQINSNYTEGFQASALITKQNKEAQSHIKEPKELFPKDRLAKTWVATFASLITHLIQQFTCKFIFR